MKWTVSIAAALALGAAIGTADVHNASAQAMGSPSPCDGFIPLRNAAQRNGMAIGVAEKRHANPKELCTLVSRFYVSEGAALKYLEANQAWCAIPEQAVAAAKENHAKTLKFRKAVCTAAVAPRPHIPTLSDAIGGPELDTAKNTKTGNGGTFDTLTGNPLAK